MNTIRYNCIENDNYLTFNMCLAKKDLYLPDEIEVGSPLDESTLVLGFNDLLDSLIIAVGYENLLIQLQGRRELNDLK